MKITIRLSILCLLILLLTGCPEEPDITVVPAPSWKAEFTIKNQISQAVPLILKPCHYSHLGDPVSLSAMKNEAALLDEALSRLQMSGNRAALVVGYQNTPLRKNVGRDLPDGAVLLTSFKKLAFLVWGQWAHAGIFSKVAYRNNGNHDGVHSVYTAQPDEYRGFPADMQPDRPGYGCMDTVYMYTKQVRCAAILPKGYTSSKGSAAVAAAKRIFYDPWPSYTYPPFQDLFFRGSYDLTNRNTYCTKVPYTAWRLQGNNIERNRYVGNIIAPDDLYASTMDEYKSFTIRFLWFSKTWRWKTYSAETDLIMRLGS